MSNVHRLRTTDRIFYMTVSLRGSVQSFDAPEYRMMIDVLEGSRARSKVARSKLITCGYRRDVADKNPTVRTTLTVATRSYLVVFSGITPSASIASTTEKVIYTYASESNSDTRAIALRKFSALATPTPVPGCPDDPNAPPPGLGYLDEFKYGILTTPGSQQVQSGFPNMTVTETSNVTSVTPSNFQFTPVTGKGGTDDSSQVDDCLGIPSSTALPSNLVVCVAQTISVGGIQVRANTLKYTNTSASIVSTCP